MAQRIEDYALLGDRQTAALVGRDGSIDWLCLPRFDSPACFAALLGDPENGYWKIGPAAQVQRTERRYRENTLVLETDFHTDSGSVRLIDAMVSPPRALPRLVRRVVGLEGRVDLLLMLVLRFGYGRIVPWVRQLDDDAGIVAVAGPDKLVLRAGVPLVGRDQHTEAEFSVSPGKTVDFALQWLPSYRDPPEPYEVDTALDSTVSAWRAWADDAPDLPVPERWQAIVRRSLLTLRALSHRQTGGIVAAPTTSLPEALGGGRNWDYRFCWLRDASFTLQALLGAGYREEAAAWRDWLERAIAGNADDVQIMYGLGGERWLDERELPWLAGYEGATPVRIGNAAADQRQLDVFGEVMDALYQAHRHGMPPDENGWQVRLQLLKHLEAICTEPDDGIWEVRGPRQHFVHSKVMAWVAFDRAVRSVEEFGRDGPADHWRELRDRLRAEICARGFHKRRGSFVQAYDSEALDASLLLLPLVGFLPAEDPRITGTIAAIESELLRDGLVRRYDTAAGADGLPGSEGMFLACSFWLVDNYVLLGRLEDAERLFTRLVALANDVGLFSEEYDTAQGRQVGNFPQAFSHVALVNSGLRLGQALAGCGNSSSGASENVVR
jgi:GH15 family glucan-1,4-alpha-glucosidase